MDEACCISPTETQHRGGSSKQSAGVGKGAGARQVLWGRAGMSSRPSAQLAWCLQQPVLKLCLLALPMHFAENIPTQHTQSSSSQTLQEARQRANPHTVHRKRHARCLTTVQQRRTTTAGRKETCGPCPQPTNSSWGSATTGNGALVSKEFCTLGAAWHTLH